MPYLTSHYFTAGFSFSDRTRIGEQFNGAEWGYSISLLGYRNKISKSAILLSEKVKRDLNIILFPCIIVTATKGYADAGGPKFVMFGVNITQYCFDWATKHYLLKTAIMKEWQDGPNTCISPFNQHNNKRFNENV